MGNLLSAGMYRLKYSKLFYILLGLLVVTLTLCYIQAIPQTVSLDVSPTEAVTQEEGYVTVEYEEQASFYPLNSLFFQYVLLNLISCGVFCPLFLSHEYSDGVLRNKLIVGRNRTQIYLGNLTVNGLYGATATVLGILTGLCVGMPMLKGFGETEPSTLVMYGLFSLITTWACVSLFTMAAMIVANRAVAVALCIVLAFGLYFLGQFLTIGLSQPELPGWPGLGAGWNLSNGRPRSQPQLYLWVQAAGVSVPVRADSRWAVLPNRQHGRGDALASAGVRWPVHRPDHGYRSCHLPAEGCKIGPWNGFAAGR